MASIYLPLIGLIQKVIYWIQNILKFLTNISVDTYWLLITGIMQHQPNNRILWDISNFTFKSDIPDYNVQTTEWNVENKNWITEDTDKMFYKIEDK